LFNQQQCFIYSTASFTLGLISRPSAKMLSLAQHADYAQHLSVYAVSCTVINEINQGQKKKYVCLLSHVKKI
jgi:hypothetical protein